MSAIISSQDAIHFALTWSLATSRTIWLDTSVFSGQPYTVQLGTHTYSALPPGLAFFTFAVVSLAQMITPLDPSASAVYIATYFSTIFGALAAVLFFKTARMFGSERASAFLTLVFAFGTSLWVYSRIYLPEALATCLGLAAVYCLLSARQKVSQGEVVDLEAGESNDANPQPRSLRLPVSIFLSGLLLGITVFVDNVAIFFYVPIFLWVIFDVSTLELSNKLANIFFLILGTFVGFIPILLYDIASTGNALSAPYGNPFIGGVQLSSYSLNFFGQGLYEILFSPASGLFLFTPFVLISVVGFYYLLRERLGESLLFLGLFTSILLPISLLSDSTYFLHNTIGPSEIVIAMPFILLPAITVLTRMKKLNLASITSYSLGAVSIVITGIIALTDPVLGPTDALSGPNASPLLATNIPLFLDQSFLTWWSFFDHAIFYAILVLIFPVALLSYWMLAGPKIDGRIKLKDQDIVDLEPGSRFRKVSINANPGSISLAHLSSVLANCETEEEVED